VVDDLTFQVEGAEAVAHAAAPLLAFKLRISGGGTSADGQPLIQAISLRCQVRIEPVRRSYQPAEEEGLFDLFGETGQWSRTLHSMLWTHTGINVPSFSGSILVDLPVPCTSDFNVAAARYFQALAGGEAPLSLLFSGTIFHLDGRGLLQVAPISWDKEAAYRLPVRAWKEMMDLYYPNTAWLHLRKDVFERLRRYRSGKGLSTWDAALEGLLEEAEGRVVR
jgi:uncharacterized protein DUF6084